MKMNKQIAKRLAIMVFAVSLFGAVNAMAEATSDATGQAVCTKNNAGTHVGTSTSSGGSVYVACKKGETTKQIKVARTVDGSVTTTTGAKGAVVRGAVTKSATRR